MLKYLFLLLPLWSAGQITSYTAAQTGVGNAEVYWPTGATHAVIFIPGAGERGTNKELLYNNGSPIYQVRQGWRPSFAVIAIQPGAYSSKSYLTTIKFLNWIYKTFPVRTFSATGLSYGAAEWYDYIKLATTAEYRAPYSAVLLSITSESQCTDKTKLCGTDTRFKDIKLWAMDGRNDSHHDKMYRYTKAMIDAGYPAKWESIPNTGHCCWNVQYGRQDVKDWLSGPVETAPPITISAGPDTTIYFPQDSFRLKPSGVPVGADVGWQIKSGPGKVVNGVLGPIYKSQTTVTLFVGYNGRTYTDDVVITAVYDPYVTLTVLDIGDATDPKKRRKLAIDVSGGLSWLLQ